MFNIERIVKPSTLKATLHVNVISKTLVFIMYLLYDHNNI
jgi:hypothetical protein